MMNYKEKTALRRRLRARRLIKRCVDEGKTLSKLSMEDGLYRNAYNHLITAAGLTAEYKAIKLPSRVAAKKRLEKSLDKVVSRSSLAEGDTKRKVIAQALIDRCLALNVSICGLARMDGVTPRAHIIKLESAGLYPTYKEKLGVSKRYVTHPDTIARGQNVFDRCKSLSTTYNALAVADGKHPDSYFRLLQTTKLMDEYREWRRLVKIKALETRLNTIESKTKVTINDIPNLHG